jgi:hypothetical protein
LVSRPSSSSRAECSGLLHHEPPVTPAVAWLAHPTVNNPFNANQVPLPTDIEGIPILVTDAISNNEGTL